MEAQNLKRKFNGTTLKGIKVRVEEAKPRQKRERSVVEAGAEIDACEQRRRQSTQRANGVLLGHPLEEGRIVKRGWTENMGTKKRMQHGKDSSVRPLKDLKMRFRTALPANTMATRDTAGKSAKKAKVKAAEKSKTNVIINEFSKATKLYPARVTPSTKRAVVYEDGKGWLDEDGQLIEMEASSVKRNRSAAILVADADCNIVTLHGRAAAAVPKPAQDLSDGAAKVEDARRRASSTSVAEESASSPSSDKDSESESSSVLSEDDHSSMSPDPSTGQLTPTGQRGIDTSVKEVHPLEALYKRSQPGPDDKLLHKKKLTPIETSFSFFDSEEAGDIKQDESDIRLPQTPHTKQDLEWRSLRSAAPTPDTAAIGKRFSFLSADRDDDRSDDDDDDDDSDDNPNSNDNSNNNRTVWSMANVNQSNIEHPTNTTTENSLENRRQEESEFRKWFFDNRGDLNRGWKKRRREEKRLQRQRENRRLSRRIA